MSTCDKPPPGSSIDVQPIEVPDTSALHLLPYQRAALDATNRFTWNCWSRQTGKSFTFSLRRVLRGLARRRNQIILSAGERQSREVMEKVRQHCQALHISFELLGYHDFENAAFRGLEARLPGGVRIIALPANPTTSRGFTGDVFLDEFAMHRDDEAIWAALFPSLLRGNGELDISSTPTGCGNLFYRLRENPEFRHSIVTLDEAVAQGLEVDAAQLRRAIADEHAWRQEFCCEFLDDAERFMSHDLIRRCQDPALSTQFDPAALDDPAAAIFIGVDVGRVRDITAIWIWRRDDAVLRTLGVEVLRNAPFSEQEQTLVDLLSRRAVQRCCIDATGMGMHLAERLVERFGDHHVEALTFTASLKCQLAGALRVAAERGHIRIPADDAITNDWHALTRIIGAGGQVRFEANRASGGHGDRFWAAALGLRASHACPEGRAEFVSGGPMRFARAGVW